MQRQRQFTGHVLVIEDDSLVRDTLELTLDQEGYDVQAVPNAAAGLSALAAALEPSVVLVDYLMPPGLNGVQFLEQVASDADLFARHAFILLSAISTRLPADQASWLAAHGVRVVDKPFDLDELHATVAQARAELDTRQQGAP